MRASPAIVRTHLAPMICVLLLAGMWGDRRLFHLPTGDPSAYHAAVRAVADALPQDIGDHWKGTDVDPPVSAVEMLKPNVLRGTRYRNTVTGETATLVVVQCRDARDMTGHFPPICYPSHGWEVLDSTFMKIRVDEIDVPVTRYRMTIESIDRFSEIVIYNFFAHPGGALEAKRATALKAAENPRLKVFGAGQFQVIVNASMPEDRQREVFQVLVKAMLPLVDAIKQGGSE